MAFMSFCIFLLMGTHRYASASFADVNFNWPQSPTSTGLGTTYTGNVAGMNCYGSDWPAYNNGVESFPAHTQGAPLDLEQSLWREGDTFYGFFAAGFANVNQGSCGSCVEVEISSRAVVGTMVDCADETEVFYRAILQNTDNGIATSGTAYGLPWNRHYDLFLGSTSASSFDNHGICSGGNALIRGSKVVECPKQLFCKSGLIPEGKSQESCVGDSTTSPTTTTTTTISTSITSPTTTTTSANVITSTASATLPTTTAMIATQTTTGGAGVCPGEPCDTAMHCRSQWGFCGITAAHCNANSQWCGSGAAGCQCGSSPSTTTAMIATQTTTGGAGVCPGNPCDTAMHCRSQWGFCGITAAHCNAKSQWCGSGAAGCQCGGNRRLRGVAK